jgi:hypothetical protein
VNIEILLKLKLISRNGAKGATNIAMRSVLFAELCDLRAKQKLLYFNTMSRLDQYIICTSVAKRTKGNLPAW